MLRHLTRYFQRIKNTASHSQDTAHLFARRTADGPLFEGCTAVITGGAGLIGSQIAREILRQGANVVVIDRDVTSTEALGNSEDEAKLRTIQLDLTDADAVEALQLDRCDILVHASGIQFASSVTTDNDEEWSASFATNVAAPVRLTRKLLPLLTQRRGNIVMITSIHAQLPSRWANYSAAKAAQAAMVREWAVDLAPLGVRVNSVAPGWVNDENQHSKLALLHQRTIPSDYIARAVTFLASDYHSGFTTGSVLTVDAGASLYSGRVPFDLPAGS